MRDSERSEDHGDPVLRHRNRISQGARISRLVGYAFYVGSLAILGVSRAFSFDHAGITAGTVVGLIAGTVMLGPAIIVGYAVKAADRADRQGEW